MKITVENSGTVGWWERRGRGGGTMLAFRSADVCSWSDSIGRPWIIRYFLTERLFGPRWGIVARDRISITRRSMMIGISVLYRFLFFAFLLVLANCFEEWRKRKFLLWVYSISGNFIPRTRLASWLLRGLNDRLILCWWCRFFSFCTSSKRVYVSEDSVILKKN